MSHVHSFKVFTTSCNSLLCHRKYFQTQLPGRSVCEKVLLLTTDNARTPDSETEKKEFMRNLAKSYYNVRNM